MIEALHEATQRLVRSVDALSDEDWRAPSLLPGWSRAHVIAHLVLNAEGLAGALEGLASGEAVPMYVSSEARDQDIEELALDEVRPVRDRVLTSTTRFADALAPLGESEWACVVARVPGGQTFPAAAVPAMRWREVEIHHADLGAGYTRRNWELAFADAAVDHFATRQGEQVGGHGFTVLLTDVERSREVGSVGATAREVRGSAADLAWWLSGRGDGEGLTCESGLPTIGAW